MIWWTYIHSVIVDILCISLIFVIPSLISYTLTSIKKDCRILSIFDKFCAFLKCWICLSYISSPSDVSKSDHQWCQAANVQHLACCLDNFKQQVRTVLLDKLDAARISFYHDEFPNVWKRCNKTWLILFGSKRIKLIPFMSIQSKSTKI